MVFEPGIFHVQVNCVDGMFIRVFCVANQWRIEGVGGFNPLPPKFRSFDKAQPNSNFRGKYTRNNLIRTQVSLICKLSGTPD
jgi:hypothetical protein